MLGGSTADEFPGGAVLDHERLSTFIRATRHVDRKTNRIRPEAFMPRRFSGRLETSIYRTIGLKEVEVWLLCKTCYEQPAKLSAYGRGDGSAKHIRAAGLTFDPNGIPHPRHADILGWLDAGASADRSTKSHWMITAHRFAGEFEFVPKPSASTPEGG